MSTPAICFIINSIKTKQTSFEKEAHHVFLTPKLIFRYTLYKGHGIELAKTEIESGCDFLIAVGGDGTVNEMVNGYMLASPKARKKVILGLLPKGTGNDFARSIFAKKGLAQLYNSIKNKHISPTDICQISFTNPAGNPQQRYFINIADIGIGANTVQIVNNSKKRLGSSITFLLAILKSFVGYKHLEVKISSPSYNYSGKIVSACFANGKWFGSGLGIAPHASLNDGKIALVVIGEVKMRTFLAKLPSLKKLTKIKHQKITYQKVEYCKIEPISEKCPLEADGEFLGYLPAEVRIYKHATQFLTSEK